MMKYHRGLLSVLFFISVLIGLEAPVFGQSYGIQTIAGTTTVKDGISASAAFLREPFAVVQDAAGNLYIADRSDNRVRKVGRDGIISTVAGTGTPGKLGDGGLAVQAQLNTPFLLALDRNNLYIGEYLSSLVRKLDLTTGILTTVAGNGRIRPVAGDGVKATQTAIDVQGIGVDSKGNLILADGTNHRLRKVAADGSLTNIAGGGSCNDSGDNGAAAQAILCFPTNLGVDSADNIYFVDYGNTRVRKIDGKSGVISAYLGDGYPLSDNDGRVPTGTSVFYPDSLAVDAAGNLYVSENSRIRYVSVSGGTVRTVAGNATLGFAGDKGPAIGAKLAYPAGIFAFSNGDLLLADTSNFRIRKVTSGTIDSIVGVSIVDGLSALTSLFNGPHGIAEDAAGNIYIADSYNHRIRKLTVATGTVSTIAGTGTPGSLEGRINGPNDVVIDSKGLIYFSDTQNNRVLQIQPDNTTKIFAGGNGPGYAGDGSFAKNAKLNQPRGLAVDKADTIYFTDSGNNRIRKVGADGLIQLVAGNGSAGYSGDGGQARSAGLSPRGVVVDPADGAIYIADYDNSRIRRVDATTGNITTIVGSGTFGNAGDGGKATEAYLSLPYSLAIDAQRNLLITDLFASVIRRVNLTTGVIATIAGTGRVELNGESGAAVATNIDPSRMFVEKNGTLLVSDSVNDRIRRLAPLTARTMTLNSGDKGSGVAGTKLAIATKVVDVSGFAIQGQTVSFVLTAGTATLSSASALTGIDGVATIQVTLGATLGAVTVRADSVGLPSVTFNLSVTAPVIVAPVISGVVGAPQSVPPVTTVSRNATALVTLGGAPICQTESICFSGVLTSPLTPPYPANLNGTCVSVGGVSAPVLLVTTASIAIIVPDVPTGAADVVVTSACGTGNDAPSAAFSVMVGPASPEFYYSTLTSDGKLYVAATMSGATIGTPESPAHQGDAISLVAVGLGATTPAEPIGDVAVDMAPVSGTVVITLGGNPLPPEAVTFVGLAPGAVPGQYRVDLTVPVDAAAGDMAVVIQIGDVVSPAGLLNIAPAMQLTLERSKMGKDEIRQLAPARARK